MVSLWSFSSTRAQILYIKVKHMYISVDSLLYTSQWYPVVTLMNHALFFQWLKIAVFYGYNTVIGCCHYVVDEERQQDGKISISVHRCEFSTSVATKSDDLFIRNGAISAKYVSAWMERCAAGSALHTVSQMFRSINNYLFKYRYYSVQSNGHGFFCI